jgi:hypothetical protein
MAVRKVGSGVEHRRKIRALEAKRDVLIQTQEKTKQQLALVRADLKHQRKAGTK